MMKLHVKRFGVHGFTLIEITLVIIVMGILAAAIAPMLAGVVGRAQADAERIKLKTLKEALLADALERGGFVDPLTSAANAGGVGKNYPGAQTRQYLATTSSALALGLPLTSLFNNQGGDNLALNAVPAYLDNRPASFLYDARTELMRWSGTTPFTFCQLAALSSQTADSPLLCSRSSAPGHDTLTPCQMAAPATTPFDLTVPAALVLASRGKNRQFEFENLEGYSASGTDVLTAATTPPLDSIRTYESPNRGIKYSNDTGAYYDDVVESISIPEVISACQKRGTLGAQLCSTGEVSVVLLNISGSTIYYPNGACNALPDATVISLPCGVGTDNFSAYSNSSCTSPITFTTTTKRSALDVNSDTTAVLACTQSGCTHR